MTSFMPPGIVLVVIFILFHRPSSSNSHDGGDDCPPRKAFVSKYTAPVNGTFALAIVKCETTPLLNITFEIRYANNSLCVCGSIPNPISGFHVQCKNKIPNMGIRITLSSDKVTNNRCNVKYLVQISSKPEYEVYTLREIIANSSVASSIATLTSVVPVVESSPSTVLVPSSSALPYKGRNKTIPGKQVRISTWSEHLVNSSVVSSKAMDFFMKTFDLTPSRTFTVLSTPGLSSSIPTKLLYVCNQSISTKIQPMYSLLISTQKLSSRDPITPVSTIAPQTLVVTTSLVSSSLSAVSAIVQPSPTVLLVPFSSAVLYKGRCQAEKTGDTQTQGTFFWESTVGNKSRWLDCLYGIQPNADSAFKPRRYCRCDDENCRKPFWHKPITESCNYKTSKQLSDIYESLLNGKKTPVNVTAELDELTTNATWFKPNDVNSFTLILENIANDTAVLNETGPSIVKLVNNILNVAANVISESEKNNKSSKRIIGVINTYLENVPIESGRNVSQDERNLAVHAQDFNVTNFQGVRVTDSEGRNLDVVNDATTNDGSFTSQVLLTMTIPKSFFESVKNRAKMQRLYFVVYRKTLLFQSQVQNFTKSKTQTVRKKNSFVIAASLKGLKVNNLPEPVESTYYPLQRGIDKTAQCVFWNFKLKSGHGDWSGNGCNYRGSSNGLVTCHCNHLTNFAMLMDVDIGDLKDDIHNKALSIISYIGCALSLFGYTVTIITILLFKDYRSKTPRQILLNFCIALALTLVVFLAAAERSKTSSMTGCRAAAVALHYFVLAAFMWMAIEAFNMYIAFVIVIPKHISRFIFKCCIAGWGLPAIIVAITASTSLDYYGDDHFCRLHGLPFFVAFLSPVLIILAGNAIAFVLITRSLLTSGSKVTADRKIGGLQHVKRAAAILSVLGLTWSFGVLAIKDAKIIFQYLFCIFNSIQGLLVFVLYSVLNTETRAKYKNRAKRFYLGSNPRSLPLDTGFQEIPLVNTSSAKAASLNKQ